MKHPFTYLATYRQFAQLNSPSNLRAGQILNEQNVAQAKKLHAKVYLHRGYVKPEDVSVETGHLHDQIDPYQSHSNYFAVLERNKVNAPVLATARQINAHPDHGHDSFPTMRELKLYPEMEDAIRALDPSRCVEISGLAKDFGVPSNAVMVLYRSLWHHSLRRNHHLWLMACDAKVYNRLKFLFGDSLTRIGDNAFYMGSEVVPAMLEVHRSIDPLMRDTKSLNPFKRQMKRELVKFFLAGLSVKFQQIQGKATLASREIAKSARENNL